MNGQREAVLETFTEHSDTWAWRLNGNGRICYLSANFEHQMGHHPSTFLDRSLFSFASNPATPEPWKALGRCFEDRAPVTGIAVPMALPDGALVWTLLFGAPDMRADGTFNGYCGFARLIAEDVGKRFSTEESTSSSEATTTCNSQPSPKVAGLEEAAVTTNEKASASSSDRLSGLAEEFQSSLQRGDFVPFYQPIYSLANESIIGLEALVRWHHPERGLLMPGLFLKALGNTALSAALFREMLTMVCRDFAAWRSEGRHVGRMGINVIPSDIQQVGTSAFILETLKASGLRPRQLVIEIAWSDIVDAGPDGEQACLAMLAELRGLDVSVAIGLPDHIVPFLTRLSEFPANILKLPRTIVDRIGNCKHAETQAKALIDFAQARGSVAIAEGIETRMQVQALKSIGFGKGQGFLFQKPCEAPEVAGLLVRLRESA